MSGEHRPIPFRWILPVAQLLLCVGMLWPVRHMLMQEVRWSFESDVTRDQSIRQDQHNAFAVAQIGPDFQVRAKDPEDLRRVLQATHEQIDLGGLLWGPALLNFPASVVELPVSLAKHDEYYWVPNGMDLHAWRAIIWPLSGLVLWWVAGRGLEALIVAKSGFVHPRITWAEIAIGALLVLMGLLALLSPLEADVRSDPDLPWSALSLAGLLWFLLGGTIIAARVMQWRLRRRLAAQADASPAAV
jgi:hypothetical protein